MMSYLLSLPRASWKARVVAVLAAVLLITQIVQQYSHLHDDLAIARWVAWCLSVSAIWLLHLVLIVCLVGRMPKVFRRRALNRTLPQIRADIAEELREQRERSRHL